jgi:hypothetical protein
MLRLAEVRNSERKIRSMASRLDKPERYSILVSSRDERGTMSRKKRKRRGSKKTSAERANLYSNGIVKPKGFKYSTKDRKTVRKYGFLKNPYNSGKLHR